MTFNTHYLTFIANTFPRLLLSVVALLMVVFWCIEVFYLYVIRCIFHFLSGFWLWCHALKVFYNPEIIVRDTYCFPNIFIILFLKFQSPISRNCTTVNPTHSSRKAFSPFLFWLTPIYLSNTKLCIIFSRERLVKCPSSLLPLTTSAYILLRNYHSCQYKELTERIFPQEFRQKESKSTY